MRVLPVPCLHDNYAYLILRDGERDALVVDPSEAEPVLAALRQSKLRLRAILNTHHHHDHVGGNEQLVAAIGGMPVYAHASDLGRIPEQTEQVEEGQSLDILGFRFSPLHVPGHTLGALAYVTDTCVFTGDTLFLSGCGRMFEGTPEMMHASLQKLARLPPHLRVYSGHEYTLNNLRFAKTIEPDSTAIAARLKGAESSRSAGVPTEGTLADELATNPFLRCDTPAVRAHCKTSSAVETFASLRKEKDSFR